jgi:hypothetical protein
MLMIGAASVAISARPSAAVGEAQRQQRQRGVESGQLDQR